jgi:hypothetical protein
MEQIGVFIIIALIGLVQFLFRWLKARAEQRASRAPAPPTRDAEPAVPTPSPRMPRELRAPPREMAPPPQRAVPPTLRSVTPQRPRRPVLGTPAQLRRAIVLMEILGPCRATERSAPPAR